MTYRYDVVFEVDSGEIWSKYRKANYPYGLEWEDAKRWYAEYLNEQKKLFGSISVPVRISEMKAYQEDIDN